MRLKQLRWLVVPVGLLLAVVLLPGCQAKKTLKLAFVSNNPANFWTIARAGTADAAKQLGNVQVDFKIPANGSPAEQQQILNDLLANGEDGIAVSPIDPGNETDFLNNVASRTLLVCTDSDAPASKRVCYIGTDNEAAGEQAGGLIKEALPNGGKIIVFVGSLDAQNAKDRYDGIKKVLAGSKIEVIKVMTDSADNAKAQANAADALVTFPNVDCMVGLYSYNGPAILNAVKSAGKTGKIKIVCFDDDDDTIAGVADGFIYGTVVQQPYEFGKQAITKMAAYLRGDKSALAGDKQIVPTMSITKDNVAKFQADKKKMLGK